MKDYVILTDAASDINLDLIERYNIEVIPMDVLVDNKLFVHYHDYRDLSQEQFYSYLHDDCDIKTSQISPDRYIDYFKKHIKNKKNIIYISLSTGLSSTYQSAILAKSIVLEKYPKARIEIVDSKAATIAQGAIAIFASVNRQRRMTIDENISDLDSVIKRLYAYFTVDDLMHLFKGGRLSKTSALVGQALKVKPILNINDNGQLRSFSKSRGRKNAIKKLLELVDNRIENTRNQIIFIVHANCNDEALKVYEKLRQNYPSLMIEICELGPVIASHTGNGLLGIVFSGKNDKLED